MLDKLHKKLFSELLIAILYDQNWELSSQAVLSDMLEVGFSEIKVSLEDQREIMELVRIRKSRKELR